METSYPRLDEMSIAELIDEILGWVCVTTSDYREYEYAIKLCKDKVTDLESKLAKANTKIASQAKALRGKDLLYKYVDA